MAQLKDTIVSGSLRATDSLLATKGYLNNSLTITNQDAIPHLIFSRSNYNYISIPSGSRLAICANGQPYVVHSGVLIEVNTDANGVTSGTMLPGKTNVMTLGSYGNKWSNTHTSNIYLGKIGFVDTSTNSTTENAAIAYDTNSSCLGFRIGAAANAATTMKLSATAFYHGADGTGTLGTNTYRWQKLYLKATSASSGSIFFLHTPENQTAHQTDGFIGGGSNGAIGIYATAKIVLRPATNDNTVGVELTSSALYPTTTNTIDLGTSTKKWNNVYTLKLIADSIVSTDGSGLLAYHPTDWDYVSNTQWGVGATGCQGIIRSSATDLIHSKNGTNYTIMDTSNCKLSNASHSVTLNNSTWAGSNPWSAGNRQLVWGQQGQVSSASSDTADMVLWYGTSSGSGGAGWFLTVDGGVATLGGVYTAVWNDFAEYRQSDVTEAGRCVVSDGTGKVVLTTKRLQPGGHIISDTFGQSVGYSSTAKTPLGVAGRVLAYPYRSREEYQVGDAVCSGPNGTIDKMSRSEVILYPDRIIGIIDEIPSYEEWKQDNIDENGKVKHVANIKINGRIWIYVK